jgi:hypothetical protein
MALTTAAALTKENAERAKAETITFRKDFMMGVIGGYCRR